MKNVSWKETDNKRSMHGTADKKVGLNCINFAGIVYTRNNFLWFIPLPNAITYLATGISLRMILKASTFSNKAGNIIFVIAMFGTESLVVIDYSKLKTLAYIARDTSSLKTIMLSRVVQIFNFS